MERSEFETKTRYSNKIESLEMEVSTLKRKLRAEEDEHKALNSLWEVIIHGNFSFKYGSKYISERLKFSHSFTSLYLVFLHIDVPLCCGVMF